MFFCAALSQGVGLTLDTFTKSGTHSHNDAWNNLHFGVQDYLPLPINLYRQIKELSA